MADHSLFPILGQFEGLEFGRNNPNAGECYCPAHDDGEKKGKKSLHVEIKPNPKSDNGESMLVLYCHAGCETKAIVEAMGLTMAALYPQGGSKPTGKSSGKQGETPRGTWDCAYDYRDASGRLVHQTIRYKNPKSFAQRRPASSHETFRANRREYKAWRDRNGQLWYWTLQGIEPVVYNLPQILKADPKKLILLCEGEKDADAAGRLGMLATTVPMGTGKWRASYTEVFRGRRVLIIPDMDRPRMGQTDPMANPGVDGARKIAAKLVGIAAEVRIVYLDNRNGQLVPKYDLSDWIAAGGDLRQLAELAAKSDLLTPGHPGLTPSGKTAADLDADAAPEIDLDTYLFPPELTSGESAAPAPALPAMLPAVITPAAAPTAPNPDGQSAGQSTGTELIRRTVSNYILTADGPEALSMRTILNTIQQATGGWPKRVGGALFYCDQESDPDAESYRIDWLDRTEALFGWLGNKLNAPLDFARVPMSHTKGEVFAETQRTCEKFDIVDRYPHFPSVPGVYYACRDAAKWKSRRPNCLMELISMFCPAADLDRDLMLASMLTLLWGGPGGSRPLFVITSDAGRGVGKTTFAELITSLVGGCLQLSTKADDETVRQRLLSPEGMEKRAVLLDNVKANKFSWAEFEALITSDVISGKRMYVGEGARPNLLTYFVTINGPSFSTDLAQRSITIKLKRPEHSGTWQKKISDFIREHRESLIAEILLILQSPVVTPLSTHTRWGRWESEVLARLSSAEECQQLILSRQKDLDIENEESWMISEQFARQLDRNNIHPEMDRVFITNDAAANWLAAALGEKFTKLSAVRTLERMIGEGRLPCLTRPQYGQRLDKTNRRERGFWWTGEQWQEGRAEYRPGNLQTFDLDDSFITG